MYNEGLKIINNALAGKYRRQLYHVENVDNGSVWFNFRHNSFVFLTVLSVTLHILAHRLLFIATEYLVTARLDETQKISPRSVGSTMVSLEKQRSMCSAVIDGIYCSLILTYGKIGSGSWVIGVLIVFFWTDFHFYVTHRLMHMSPFLYKNVHYIHHQSHNVNVWSSLSFHPVEAIIFFSAYLIVLVVPMPTFVWWSFKLGMVLGPLHAHIGYDLGAVVKGPAHHYLHHALKNGNFGGFPTGLWDKLFGTELSNTYEKKQPSINDSKRIPSMFLRKCIFLFLLYQFVFDYEIPLALLAAASVIVWLALLDGMLVIFPPLVQRKWSKKKVFVVGLSRTGTTSITEALNVLGIRTHHFCGKMVEINCDGGNHKILSSYIDYFDGHTDIAPTIVAEQLAEKYPEALFIYTTRPRDEWARALVRFVSEQPRKCLFTTHPTPRKFYDAAYGDGWSSYTIENWKSIHKDHENRMQSLRDKVGGHRFLKIDITSHGKNGEDKKKCGKFWGIFLTSMSVMLLKHGSFRIAMCLNIQQLINQSARLDIYLTV